MIFGYNEEEIVKKAMEYQSEMTDGVVQYDYSSGKLVGAGFTTGTVENPENPVIEVFRLRQGELLVCSYDECVGCERYNQHSIDFDGDMTDSELGESEECIDCYIDAYSDDGFSDDWENNFRDGVEEQIREVLEKYLSETLEKIDSIRCELIYLEKGSGLYQQAKQQNWAERSLENYIDLAVDEGFIIDGDVDAVAYCDAEMQHIKDMSEYFDPDRLGKQLVERVADCLKIGDLDGALEMLQ